MTDGATADATVDWLLDDMVKQAADIRHAAVVSTDGMTVLRAAELARDDADQLAAITSGMQSLAKHAGLHFAQGAVRQLFVEFDLGYLVVTAAGSNACLVVLTEPKAELGQIAYDMNRMVQRVGEHLGVETRGTAVTAPDGLRA